MPLSTLLTVDMLKMQFKTCMVNIIRGLRFFITLEVVVTIVVVLMILETLAVATIIVVVALIPMIAGSRRASLSLYHFSSNRYP